MKTTISNLPEGMTIEKAVEIVESAPDGATHIIESFEMLDYLKFDGNWWIYIEYQNAPSEWGLTCFKAVLSEFQKTIKRINDLRAAIDHHYYGRSEAEELEDYAELQREIMEGGASLKGNFSNAVNRAEQLIASHREFKVRDLVVAIDHTCTEIFEIERKGRDGEFYDTRWRRLHIELFRHATLEEIAAGHRIDSDDTTDIRNHVSPSCEARMDKCREAFEQWFKTTKAYQLLKEMNYFNMDLFHFVDARNEYRHSSVQIAFMTWQSRQAEVDQLETEKAEMTQALLNQAQLLIEKDKRIEELEKSEFALAKVKQILNKHIKTKLLESLIVRELIDLLFSNKAKRGDDAT